MQEYRLEFWRVAKVNNRQKPKKVFETDFTLDTRDDVEAKKQADILATHYEPDVKWYDWKGRVHPTMRFPADIREVKNQTEQCVEFIVLYLIYPFYYESQYNKEVDNDEN